MMLFRLKCTTSLFVINLSRYASQLGYFKDDFSKIFLKTKKKMFPIINRGTWARVFAYRSLIKRFLTAFKENSVNILSLGAGYDTTFFWLLQAIESGEIEYNKDNLFYIEVDFDEVVV